MPGESLSPEVISVHPAWPTGWLFCGSVEQGEETEPFGGGQPGCDAGQRTEGLDYDAIGLIPG